MYGSRQIKRRKHIREVGVKLQMQKKEKQRCEKIQTKRIEHEKHVERNWQVDTNTTENGEW